VRCLFQVPHSHQCVMVSHRCFSQVNTTRRPCRSSRLNVLGRRPGSTRVSRHRLSSAPAPLHASSSIGAAEHRPVPSGRLPQRLPPFLPSLLPARLSGIRRSTSRMETDIVRRQSPATTRNVPSKEQRTVAKLSDDQLLSRYTAKSADDVISAT